MRPCVDRTVSARAPDSRTGSCGWCVTAVMHHPQGLVLDPGAGADPEDSLRLGLAGVERPPGTDEIGEILCAEVADAEAVLVDQAKEYREQGLASFVVGVTFGGGALEQ